MGKVAASLLAAALAAGAIVTASAVHAEDRGPVGPGGVVGPVGVDPVVGPAGPVGVGGLGPVAGPVGPVGVGGVVGPVGVDPVVDAAVRPYYYVPFFPGEIPCYTPEGVAYFTPPGEPCY